MERIQNTSENQSYFDPSDNVCSVENSTDSSTQRSEVASQQPESAPRPLGTSVLVESYSASGSGGTGSIAESVGTGGASGIPESTPEESTLCEERLLANRILCSLASGAINRTIPLVGFASVVTGAAIGLTCNTVADWLEYNTSMGACGDDD